MAALDQALGGDPRQAAALAAVLYGAQKFIKVEGIGSGVANVASVALIYRVLKAGGLAPKGGAVGSAIRFILMFGLVQYILHLLRHFYLRQCKRLPPGPIPLPILGSLHLVGKDFGPDGLPRIHRNLGLLFKQYGYIYGLYLGAYYTVVVGDPVIAKNVFVVNGRHTSDRAPMQSHGGHHVPSMYIATRDGKGIAMSTGTYWRRMRTALEANISRQAPAEKNAPMILRETESFMTLVRDVCEKSGGVGTFTDLTGWLKRESMNISTTLLFGMRFGADMPQDFKILQHSVEYIFKNLSSGNPSDMIPIFRIFPSPFLREFQHTVNERDRVLGAIIANVRTAYDARRRSGKLPNPKVSGKTHAEKQEQLRKTREPCINLTEQFLMDQEAGDMTADEVHVVIWDILFAMTDTSASTAEWMLYYCINYPEVQAKIHEELDRVVGPDRLPRLEDRDELKYLWAVIKEVMRIKIISPVLAPHYCSKDVDIEARGKKYTLPVGTAIFVNAFDMARNPEFWGPDATEFKPERWLDDPRNEGLDVAAKETRRIDEHYKFIPFSLGDRACPGYSFGKVATFMFVGTMMHCFDWSLSAEKAKTSKFVKDGKLDLEECWGLTIMPRRYGDMELVAAKPRPASRLCKDEFDEH